MKRKVLIASVVAFVLVAALVAVAAVAAPRVSAAPADAPSATRTPRAMLAPKTTSSTAAYLGITIVNINSQIAEKYNLDLTEGVVIASVVSDSPAAAAGLQAGDVVNQVNSVAVKTAAEVVTEVQKAKAGDVVTVNITRAGKAMTVKVTSTAAPTTEMRRGLRGDDIQPKATVTPGTRKATPTPGTEKTAPRRGYQTLPAELEGLLNLSFDSNYGSTQTFKDANGNVVTVSWIPGKVSAISATSITITPNNPQSSGGPFTIDDTTIISGGTNSIAANDEVTIVVVGDSDHASIIMAGSSMGGMRNWGSMHNFDMPFGGRNFKFDFDFRMPFSDGDFDFTWPFGRGDQEQQPKTPDSGA